jgi:Protein of unknown function (DUF4038)
MSLRSRRGFLKAGSAALVGVVGAEGAQAVAKESASRLVQVKALPRVRVHPAGHFLETENGDPFFWLGDTAWQLIAGTTREECSYYLHTRGQQGFSVIQAVVLAEFDGIRRSSPLGLSPFAGGDPRHPDPAYFHRVREMSARQPPAVSTSLLSLHGETNSQRRGGPAHGFSATIICPMRRSMPDISARPYARRRMSFGCWEETGHRDSWVPEVSLC